MCNYIRKNGQKCLLSPKRDLCHIHKKNVVLEYKQAEIVHLNRTIAKKNELYKSEIKSLRNENEKYQSEIESLQTVITYMEKQIADMQEDFNSYNKIKKYELIKSKLAKHVYDVSDLYEVKYFCREHGNAKILTSIFGEQTDYWRYYNDLRLQRNKLCHVFV